MLILLPVRRLQTGCDFSAKVLARRPAAGAQSGARQAPAPRSLCFKASWERKLGTFSFAITVERTPFSGCPLLGKQAHATDLQHESWTLINDFNEKSFHFFLWRKLQRQFYLPLQRRASKPTSLWQTMPKTLKAMAEQLEKFSVPETEEKHHNQNSPTSSFKDSSWYWTIKRFKYFFLLDDGQCILTQ